MTNFLRNYRPRGFATYFAMTYAKPFWRENGNSGQIIYSGVVDDLLWATTFDTSENNLCGHDGVTGILWGIAHFKSENITEAQRQSSYKNLIEITFPNAPQPMDISDYQFYNDQYSLGSIGVLPVSKDASVLSLLGALSIDDNTPYSEQRRKRFSLQSPSIHFTSAELSKESMGMMNGAVLHGQLVAEQVLKQLAANPSPSVSSPSRATPYSASPDQPSTIKPEASSLLYPDDLMNDKGTTTFAYRTTPQYPSSESQTPPLTSTAKYDFPYATSPMYPDSFETTTVKPAMQATTLDYTAEFLGSSTKESSTTTTTTTTTTEISTTKPELSSLLYPDDLMNDNATTTFAYATSPQYETSEEPKETTPKPQSSTSSNPENETTPFAYETSSQYPATSSEEPILPPYQPVYDFPYSTSTQYPSDFYPTTGASYDQEAQGNTTTPSNETMPAAPSTLVPDLLADLLNATTPAANVTEVTEVTEGANVTELVTTPSNETMPTVSLEPDFVADLLNPTTNPTTKPENVTEVPEAANVTEPMLIAENVTIVELINATFPGDTVTDLLNETTTIEPATNQTVPVETISDLNGTSAVNETEVSTLSVPVDTVLDLLNPSAPENKTESPVPVDEVLDLLNPTPPSNEIEPKNVTKTVDELLNLLNAPENKTVNAPIEEILDLLNPKAPENGTGVVEETKNTNLPVQIDKIFDLLNPKAPENGTVDEKSTVAPAPAPALVDLIWDLLNPSQPPENVTQSEPASQPASQPANFTETLPTAPTNATAETPELPTTPTNATAETPELPTTPTNATAETPELPTTPTNATTETLEVSTTIFTLNDTTNLVARDSPQARENSTAPFEYHTSSPYPPDAFNDTQPILQTILNESFAFPYSTSTQYPLDAFPTPQPLPNTTAQPDLAVELLSADVNATTVNNVTTVAPDVTNATAETPQEIVQDAVKQVEQNIQKIPLSNRKPIAGRLANVLASLLNLVRRR
ncbi:unnamed protein product, partial [Mesorhabditis belari]|uniref:monoamine oxidase n=1 Tax=Mesorhabditis belari TaxID=2138241 RepID=A0AAF3EDI6_9BILA